MDDKSRFIYLDGSHPEEGESWQTWCNKRLQKEPQSGLHSPLYQLACQTVSLMFLCSYVFQDAWIHHSNYTSDYSFHFIGGASIDVVGTTAIAGEGNLHCLPCWIYLIYYTCNYILGFIVMRLALFGPK